jgi:hypothetical protein
LAVCARFERDHHNHLIRQFFHIRQLDSVTEYVDNFDTLMHQILAHDPMFSLSAIVNHFIDTIVSLAMLQEENLHLGNIATTRRLTDTTGNLTTSRLPSLAVLSQTSSVGDVKHHKEVSKIGLDEHKAATLVAFRKAKGLCYKCGLRWGPTHKCSTNVPLHVAEELWQLLDTSGTQEHILEPTKESSDDLMTLSVNAVQGIEAPQTVTLIASMFSKIVVMLVDSGSSSSFIS